jgi:hypothetical protein
MGIFRQIWTGLKAFWAAWTRLAKKIGTFQARVLLTIMYAIAVLPFGLGVRWFGDTLRTKQRPTGWLDHPDEAGDMEWARRQ